MSRIAVTLTTVIVAIGGVALGYWLGVRDGLRIGVMAEWAPRAALSTAVLRSLKTGATDNAVILLESDVDNGLLWSHNLAQSPIAPLLEPVWGLKAYPADEAFVRRLAKYRALNPSPASGVELRASSSGDPEAKNWHDALVQQGALNDQIIRGMVTRYGKQ